MKICKNCRFYKSSELGVEPKCMASRTEEFVNIVTGKKFYSIETCRDMRNNETKCGKEGKLFKRKRFWLF